MSRIATLALAAAAALTLAACGGSGGQQHAAGHAGDERVHEPVPDAPAVELTAVDIDFEPAALELQAGEPTNVTVVNKGEAVHDLTLEEADVHMNVEPGAEATTAMTIDQPGTYTAFCSVPGHKDAGMTVEVTVAE